MCASFPGLRLLANRADHRQGELLSRSMSNVLDVKWQHLTKPSHVAEGCSGMLRMSLSWAPSAFHTSPGSKLSQLYACSQTGQVKTKPNTERDKGITQSILRFLHFGYTASCWPTPKNSHSVRFECGRQAFNPRPAYSKAWISGHTSEKSQQIQWFHINSLGCELN